MKKIVILSACLFGIVTIHAARTVNAGCLEKEKAIAILETAETLLTKARDSFPSCDEGGNSTDESECGRKKPLAYIEISKKLISDVRQNFPTCPKPIGKDDKIIKDEKHRDCSEILASGRNVSGVYTIWVGETLQTGKPLKVYCDMDTDKGGWTMIQRRGKFAVQRDFFLGWESYKNGFGNISEEFWLGNENIRVLCLKGCEIRFDLQDQEGNKGFAHYKNFNLSSDNYRIHISGYTGNVGDGMQEYDNIDFSTKDKGLIEIAVRYEGAWWYRSDYHMCNLNGIYKPWQTYADFNVFCFPWRPRYNLANAEMKVRSK